MSSHSSDVPLKVGSADGSDAQRCLDTTVAHIAHVVHEAGETGRESHGAVKQHVLGQAVVEVHVQLQAVVEQDSVEASVEVLALLPRYVLVLERRNQCTDVGSVAVTQVIQ